MAENTGKYVISIVELLTMAVESKASDIHMVCGFPPSIRVGGNITPMDLPRIMPDAMEDLVFSIVDPPLKEEFEKKWELDFSHSIPGVARFRGSVMKQRGTVAAVFRVVPFTMPKFEDLGLPNEIKDLCNQTRGLVLVTGPTGSGKSTTLAALIDLINETQRVSIITIEDPIEFLHRHKMGTVRQREIGTDTHSFSAGLRHALRHDPDVILIGEMRDEDSIGIALTAAETGHLVFSTLHTQTAPLAIARIVDAFSNEKKNQIRQQLAGSLRAIISQQLIPLVGGKGRTVALEYMTTTPAIRNLIRDGKDHQLYSAIQTGQALGMRTMDQSLVRLFKAHKIDRENVYNFCVDRNEVDRLMNLMYV